MRKLIGSVAAALFVAPAFGHSPLTASGADRVAASLSLLLVCALWGWYWLGSRRTAASVWRRGLFHGTMILTLLTVLGPLDSWAEDSSAAHMFQHMMMMAVIAPLIAWARPMPQFFSASGEMG